MFYISVVFWGETKNAHSQTSRNVRLKVCPSPDYLHVPLKTSGKLASYNDK